MFGAIIPTLAATTVLAMVSALVHFVVRPMGIAAYRRLRPEG